jgi:hypothetical protein
MIPPQFQIINSIFVVVACFLDVSHSDWDEMTLSVVLMLLWFELRVCAC